MSSFYSVRSILACGLLSCAIMGAAQAKPMVGLAVANLQADFFNQIKQSVAKEAKEKDVDLIVVDAHGDSATQVNQIQDLITRGVNAIIYIPAGATAAGVPVRMAELAHIPVVAVDRNAPDAPAQTFIATDSVASARKIGEFVCEKTGGKGQVAIVQGQTGTTPERDRAKGFDEALAKCPGLKIVAQQPSQMCRRATVSTLDRICCSGIPTLQCFWPRRCACTGGCASDQDCQS